MQIDLAALTLLGSVLASSVAAEAPRCQGRPELSGACFVVHGRLSDANGNPTLRIWPVGTSRMLGVREGYELPANIRDCVGWGRLQNLYADFLVCPLAAERRGHMRPVCVESASGLVLERFSDYKDGRPVSVRWLDQDGCALVK